MAKPVKQVLVTERNFDTALCVWADTNVETLENIEGVAKAYQHSTGIKSLFSVVIDPRYEKSEVIAEICAVCQNSITGQ